MYTSKYNPEKQKYLIVKMFTIKYNPAPQAVTFVERLVTSVKLILIMPQTMSLSIEFLLMFYHRLPITSTAI